jgi:hypothetical protein
MARWYYAALIERTGPGDVVFLLQPLDALRISASVQWLTLVMIGERWDEGNGCLELQSVIR